jgi:hypothetical protein
MRNNFKSMTDCFKELLAGQRPTGRFTRIGVRGR